MAGFQLGTGTTTLRSIVRSLCFQKLTDVGLFDATQLDDFINIAHRQLWNEITEIQPSRFAKRSADKTTSASTPGLLDMSGANIDTDGVLTVKFVELKRTNGDYMRLSPMAYQEGEWPGIGGSSRGITEPNSFTFLGEAIYVAPEPSAPVTVRVTYVPGCAALGATSYPFGGALAQYHEVVAYRAAVMALEKDKARQAAVKASYETIRGGLERHLRRRQSQGGNMVLMTDPETT